MKVDGTQVAVAVDTASYCRLKGVQGSWADAVTF
jgi:hypothetical protein